MSRMVGMLIMMSQSHECASAGLSLGCCVVCRLKVVATVAYLATATLEDARTTLRRSRA